MSGAPGHNAAGEAIRDLAGPAAGAEEWLARAQATGPLPSATARGLALHRLSTVPGVRRALHQLGRQRGLRPIVRRTMRTDAAPR